MFLTGRATPDIVDLYVTPNGDGRRVSDRKVLEKRRTMGETNDSLGRMAIEYAIRYRTENEIRRKRKMYHVISRCRALNEMRKLGEPIRRNHVTLSTVDDMRLREKKLVK